MFKFDFDVDVDEEADAELSNISPLSNSLDPGPSTQANLKPSTEIPLDSLLSALPPLISYSPLSIPLSAGKRSLTLARRDLFDARFQLISLGESEEHAEDEQEKQGKEDPLSFLDAPSDLIPGVYEGGLKTWECSLDLIDCLDGILSGDVRKLRGKRVLEVGCGTAIPSLYLLHLLFSSEDGQDAEIDLQDYNDLVLRLVTLPNVILIWFMSPASLAFREANPEGIASDGGTVEFPPADPSQPGELPLTPDFISAFKECLSSRRVSIRFFDGSWDSYIVSRPYNLVLTSETIYRQDSLRSLVALLSEASCGSKDDTQSLEKLTQQQLKISSGEKQEEESICLVAAKSVYFGVGGGVAEFTRAVRELPQDGQRKQGTRPNGEVETIWERTDGVKRQQSCMM